MDKKIMECREELYILTEMLIEVANKYGISNVGVSCVDGCGFSTIAPSESMYDACNFYVSEEDIR